MHTDKVLSGLKIASVSQWKNNRCGESVGHDDYVFIGQRGPITRQAVSHIVRKVLKKCGLYSKGRSVHAFRHSFGYKLLKAGNGSLKLVQK